MPTPTLHKQRIKYANLNCLFSFHKHVSNESLKVFKKLNPCCVQLLAKQVISIGFTMYGDCTVGSRRHSKLSALVVLCMETILCAAVGTASHQNGLEACTVYGDRTVCSCRHSKSPAWVRSM